MKILINKLGNKRLTLIFTIILIIFILLNIIGYFYNIKSISVIAVINEINRYEVISGLLIDSLDHIGTCNAEDAANVWAEGIKMRNGAMQASAMTKELRTKYIEMLNKNFNNWVTGMSSPWINSYAIVEDNKINETHVIKLKFDTITSTGPYKTYYATIKIKKEDEYWRIYEINTDKEFEAYTGFY